MWDSISSLFGGQATPINASAGIEALNAPPSGGLWGSLKDMGSGLFDTVTGENAGNTMGGLANLWGAYSADKLGDKQMKILKNQDKRQAQAFARDRDPGKKYQKLNF